jgi:GNAT superfamily N-acetyltransferase
MTPTRVATASATTHCTVVTSPSTSSVDLSAGAEPRASAGRVPVGAAHLDSRDPGRDLRPGVVRAAALPASEAVLNARHTDPCDSSGEPAHPDPLEPAGDEWHRRVSLRDGTRVLLRPIRREDRQRLVEGMKRLSPASRYLRFHTTVSELSEEQLDYLSDVDHVDHEAIVALDLDHPDRPGVGVARYIREPYEPHVAEAAITVADEYHGQGAGTLLLGALAARARANDITVFRNYVLDGNRAMLEVFDHLGAHRELETDGLWRVDLDVPADDADVPNSGAGRAFLEVAREEHALASLIPPIWSRWRRRHHTHEDVEQWGQRYPELLAEELGQLREDLDHWLEDPEHR